MTDIPAGRNAQDDPQLGALVRARTTLPSVSARSLPRASLQAGLDQGAAGPVTLVSAGPGWGKSELVRAWAARRAQTAPVGWVSLGEDCNDPHRFWSLVLAGLRQAAPDLRPLQVVRPPGEVDESFLFQVMITLQDLAQPLVLVLEDVHELRTGPALAALDLLVGMLPGQLRLVLVSRSDPPIALHRLRLEGGVTDVRQSVLAFGDDEARELFGQHGLALDDQELRQLMLRTEGWPAGLRLAAMALEGRQSAADRADAIAQFAGDERSVVDYLMAEVLGAQPEPLRQFLLTTSVVERIGGGLANALTGSDNGAESLEALERSGALLVALDPRRRWYRYHRLFLEMCRHRLQVEHPGAAPLLHARAARWFDAHGEPLEAARHAVLARDWHLLAQIAVTNVGSLVFGYEGGPVRTMLSEIPQESAGDPLVACARALACHGDADPAEFARRLAATEQALAITTTPRPAAAMVLSLLRAGAARADYDLTGAARHAEDALRLCGELSREQVPGLARYAAQAHVTVGSSLVWQGQLKAAAEHLRAARALIGGDENGETDSGAGATAVHAHAYLSLVLAMQGSLGAARREAESALAIAAAAGWSEDVHLASAHLALSLVRLHRAERDEALAEVEAAALMLDQHPDLFLEIGCCLVGLRTLALGHDQVRVAQTMAELRSLLAKVPDVPFLVSMEDFVVAQADLDAGRPEEALVRLRAFHQGSAVRSAFARALEARALVMLNRPAEAIDMVGTVAGPSARELTLLESWLVVAQAHEALRNDAAALTALGQALEVAAPEGLAGPFLCRMPRLGALLERHAAGVRTHGELVARILGQAPQGCAGLTETLTDREVSVLQLLPTMMSNAEIADELHVSVNTVKAHLKSLYRKLEVSSRREAVRRGESLVARRS